MLFEACHLIGQWNGMADDLAGGFVLKQIAGGDVLDRLQAALSVTHVNVAINFLAAVWNWCRFEITHCYYPPLNGILEKGCSAKTLLIQRLGPQPSADISKARRVLAQ